MATAYLIHGYLGVGKTTLAKRLERQHNAVRFTHDEWMVTLYGRDPEAAVFQSMAANVSAVMEPLWRRCLEVGANVVLDLNFWSRRQRDHVRRVALETRCEFRLISVVCSETEAKKRIAARNNEAGAMYIAPQTYEALKLRFEPLQDDEVHQSIET